MSDSSDLKTKEEEAVFWVVGALERLATLGFLDPDVPWQVAQEKVQDWVELDNNRFSTFSEFELLRISNAVLQAGGVDSREDRESVLILLHCFWGDKDRYKLMQSALENKALG